VNTTDTTPTGRNRAPRGKPPLGPFVSPSEAATYLGRGRTHVYKLMTDKVLPWYEEEGTPGRRIRVVDLDRLLRRGRAS
jgi:excisionase family DNA binding protein